MRASSSCARPARPRRILAILAALALAGCDPIARGDEAWAVGDAPGAIDAWEGLDELDDARRQQLARALYQVGRGQDAASIALSIPPEQRTAEGHLVAGLLRADVGDLEAALASFEAGLAAERLPELLVDTCAARGALRREALEICQEAVEAAPMDPRAYLGLAEAAVAAGRDDAARAALKRAKTWRSDSGAGYDPTSAASLASWSAQIWSALDEHGEACVDGRSGLSASSPPSHHVAVGRSCAAAGRWSDARAILEPIADLPDAVPDAPLGSVPPEPSADDPRIMAAATLFTMALSEAEAQAPGAQRELALARAERWGGRLGGAPVDAALETDRGRLAALRGQPLEAERRWRAAIAMEPLEAAPRLNLGRLLIRRDNYDAARQVLDLAEPIDDAVPAAGRSVTIRGFGDLALQLELARLDRLEGEPERARTRAEGVLDACEEQEASACLADATWMLARLAATDGRPDEALSLLERAIALGGPGRRAAAEREPDFDALRADLRFHDLIGER